GGNRPAQAPVVYVQFRNMPADDMGRDAAARGFDFGEFRHDMRCETTVSFLRGICRGRTIAQSERLLPAAANRSAKRWLCDTPPFAKSSFDRHSMTRPSVFVRALISVGAIAFAAV